MQGVQPSPKSTPSSGAPPARPPAPGGPASRAAARAPTPMKTSPTAMVSAPSTIVIVSLVLEEPLAQRPDRAPNDDEHEARSRARTAACRRASGRAGRLEVGAGQAGGVGEVAGQQGHHARVRRTRPARRQRPPGWPAAATRQAWSRNQSPRSRGIRSRARPRPGRPGLRGWHLAEDAGRDPALAVDDDACSGWRSGSACRGRPAGSRRSGRRGSGRARRSALEGAARSRLESLVLMPRKTTSSVASSRAASARAAPPCGTARTTTPRR